MYSWAGKPVISGKISPKCTLGQPVLVKLTHFVRFELEKRCRRVHFGDILPESCLLTAQAYKICASCHAVSGAFAQDSRRRTYAPYLSSPASGDGATLWPALARSIVAARIQGRLHCPSPVTGSHACPPFRCRYGLGVCQVMPCAPAVCRRCLGRRDRHLKARA